MRLATLDDLLDTLDGLFGEGDLTRRGDRDAWADILSRPGHPLASALPDANLRDWAERGLLPGGSGRTALDVGCGLGRNTTFLAGLGYHATGVDLSPYAVQVARSRDPRPTFHEVDVLRQPIPGGPFEVVYDSGCFHHLPPHRRLSYLTTLSGVLKPGGLFGICTFAAGRVGSAETDLELFRQGTLSGGIGFSVADLRHVFSDLEFLTGGPLPAPADAPADVFTQDFLMAALFRRLA